MNKDQSMVVPSGQGMTKSFGSQSLERAHETASAAVAAQARAVIESRYTMAMHRPRDPDTVRAVLLKDCKRPTFASVARYLKPVGGGIEGLSIRFVEAALRAMTNVLIESTTVYEDGEKRIVRVSATDLESNVFYSQDVTVTKTVERKYIKQGQRSLGSRLNSEGKVVHLVDATDDEVLNKHQALVSKAIRTLGLRLIPGDLADEAEQLCIATAAAKDAADPDGARKEIVDAFDGIGVSPRDLAAYLGHDLAQSSPAELEELRAVFVAVREGEATWSDAVTHKRAQRGELDEAEAKKAKASSGGERVKERIAKRKQAADAAAAKAAGEVKDARKETPPPATTQTKAKAKAGGKKATPRPEAAPEDDVPDFEVDPAAAAAATPELEDEEQVMLFARVEEALQEADSTEELEAALKLAARLGDADRKALSAIAQKRAIEIGGQS